MITDADVAEFQGLYEKQFGRPIDRKDAFKKLTLLVRQMELVYRPIKKSAYVNGDENGRTNNTSRFI
jgi:hypothetical protein